MRLARNLPWRKELTVQTLDVPTFLCPALLSYNTSGYLRLPPFRQQRSALFKAQRRCLHSVESKPAVPESPLKRQLPIQCTGCGAYAQTSNEKEAGFYSLSRNSVKAFLQGKDIPEDLQSRRKQEEEIVLKALQNADNELASSLNIDISPTSSPTST